MVENINKGFGNSYNSLGNYVHLHFYNYNKYGVYFQGYKRNKPRKKNDSIYQEEVPNQSYIYNKAAINSWMNQKIEALQVDQSALEEFKNRANMFSQKTMDEDKREIMEYNDIILEAIYKYIAGISSEYGFFHGNTGKGGKGIKSGEGTSPFQIHYDKYEKYKKQAKKLKTTKQVENKKNKLKKLKDEFDDLMSQQPIPIKNFKKYCNKCNKFLEGLGLPKDFLDYTDDSAPGILENLFLTVTFLTTIQDVSGFFGEALISTLDDSMYGNAKASVDDVIRHTITSGAMQGNKVSSAVFTPDDLVASDYLGKKIKNDKTFVEENGNIYEIHPSKDKVDVKITIKGQDFFANVKTRIVNTDDISMQDNGVSLFRTLIYLNKNINYFGTHWMNLHSMQLTKKGKTVSDNYGARGKNRNHADEMLKQHMVYEAFSSGTALKNSQSANVFVYVNRRTGKVQVLPIYNIIKDYIKNPASEIIKLDPDLSTIRLANSKTKLIKDRLLKNILELRQYNIKVIYKADVNRS